MKIIAALGDYYHNEANLKEALSQVTDTIDDADIRYTDRENLIEELKDMPDLVVLGSENRIDPREENPKKWMSESDEAQITSYVKNGGAWLTWHSGLAGYDGNSSYIDMVGGSFTHHPEKHVEVDYQYIEGQEITGGENPFKIVDEHYFIDYNDDISIFLDSVSEHGESVAGWTKSYGKGKVCAYIPAHNREGLLTEAVQTDLREIIGWLAAR